MFPKSLLCVAALLLLATLAAGGSRRRDSRVHDSAPSDVEHHDGGDDDRHDDDAEGDDDRDKDDGEGGRSRGRHDSKYDHESFLGRSESRRFDQLSAEESKKQLTELFAKVDKNNDTQISEAEMAAWLTEIARQDREQKADSRFQDVKAAINAKDMNSSLSFDEWKQALHHEVMGDDPGDKEAEASFNVQAARDLARWNKADANGDKMLDKGELTDFIFPENAPRMKELVVAEALNMSDANRDGKLDLIEYMREVLPEYEKDKRKGKQLPKWAVKEEEYFKTKLDLNKDGVMDAQEIYKWTVPDDIDHSNRETKHLFDTSDGNKDKFLSKDEVLKNWETFVGHRATNYGEFGARHEEL